MAKTRADLLKCLALGGRAGAADLREWATRELRGYPNAEDVLPDYRLITSALLMDGIIGNFQVRGKLMSALELPEVARDHVSRRA